MQVQLVQKVLQKSGFIMMSVQQQAPNCIKDFSYM
jgi:hypothetical protein